ncbi:cupin domain-containing protein [Azospirillum doebereinerae]|uniref:Cupin domain-containing protein n=1 Tax=Azospirillum doebereinerae TaxID=92933 RepID=A0A433J364_9PROT|nr:cupin domain-containing protein [Azospirillum doebereinerae]MCG5241572.1 cupin domain-containing protein [Azospirillum doebereinerae]RUQ66183.1 cupin domain-containing protein [Azospirillum doebereinerae]
MATDVFVKDATVDWQDLGAGVRRKILGYNDAMMMVRVEFETGAIGPLHSHPHVQCAVVEKGAFDVTIDGRTQRLATGDGYIVPPNVVHGVVALEPGVLLDVFTPIREDFLA